MCVSHTRYLVHENNKDEAKESSRLKNNSKRVVLNMSGKNVGTIRGESLTQGLISDKDLTIEVPEERESPYLRLD